MKVENDDELAVSTTSIEALKAGIAPFRFASSSSEKVVVRRSSRSPVKRERFDEPRLVSGSPLQRGLKRSLEEADAPLEAELPRTPAPSPRKRKSSTPSPVKRGKRPYAPPENYAHLNVLPDHLKEGLDIMFCGINPGQKSAELGHHFGHASNNFWQCLHLSGLTDTRLPPEEDGTLPGLYNLGLTNLVERPTAEEAELSAAEMQANVGPFLSKVATWKPRIVCFVGLNIAGHVLKKLQSTKGALSDGEEVKKLEVGLQPYKLVYEELRADTSVKETQFFAAPSSSARVVQYQLKAKVAIFTKVKEYAEATKADPALDTSGIRTVDMTKLV